MDIRVNPKYYRKMMAAYQKSRWAGGNSISINQDPIVQDSVMVIKTDTGKLVEWFRGVDNALSYLEYGYVRLRKYCPVLRRRCLAERCQHYVIQRDIGDCATVWGCIK